MITSKIYKTEHGWFELADLMCVTIRRTPQQEGQAPHNGKPPGPEYRNVSLVQLEEFILRWHEIVDNMHHEPSWETLHTFFKDRVQHVKMLEFDMQTYERSIENIDVLTQEQHREK